MGEEQEVFLGGLELGGGGKEADDVHGVWKRKTNMLRTLGTIEAAVCLSPSRSSEIHTSLRSPLIIIDSFVSFASIDIEALAAHLWSVQGATPSPSPPFIATISHYCRG